MELPEGANIIGGGILNVGTETAATRADINGIVQLQALYIHSDDVIIGPSAIILLTANNSGNSPGKVQLGGNNSNGGAHGGSAGAPDLSLPMPVPYGNFEYPSLPGSKGGMSASGGNICLFSFVFILY